MLKKIILLFLALILLSPNIVLADGMLIPSPSRYVFETDQKGVVFFEDKKEILILSAAFNGNANDFAWVIPTPTRPTVGKGYSEIFTSLRDLTETQNDYPMMMEGFGGVSYGLKDATQSVRVLEEKQIEYYDIAILEANDKEALADWLNDNGYHFPVQYSYILDSYINNNWYFSAVKITKSVEAQKFQTDMWNGNLIPLRLEFATEKPVFPLRISSVIEEPTKKSTPTYIDGRTNKSVALSRTEELSAKISSVDLKNGTIDMWFKNDAQNSYIPLLLIYDSAYQERLYLYANNGQLSLRLYDSSYRHRYWWTEKNLNFQGWHHIAVTWQENAPANFYYDGKLLANFNESNQTYPNPKTNAGDTYYTVYPGGNARTDNIYIDQLKVSDVAKSSEEIMRSFNNGGDNQVDTNTLLSASFDDNLNYFEKSSNIKTFTYNDHKPVTTNYNKPSKIGIELYIFTPDKEQTLPGFETKYAAWIEKAEIGKLAFKDNGEPWINLKNDKYYLTKLTRYMPYSEMTSDLFFRDAAKNSDTASKRESKAAFYFISVIGIFITLAVSIFIINQFNRD